MYSFFAIIAKTTHALPEANDLAARIMREQPEYTVARKFGRLFFLDANSKASGLHTYVLNSQQGIIAGTLFRRAPSKIGENVPPNIDKTESELIINSKGRHLIKNYWGRYTAFLTDNTNAECHIVSDPTGVMPAYYFESKNLIVSFSNFEQFLKLKLTKFTINNEHIDCFLAMPLMTYSDTGIREVKQVLRGSALSIEQYGKVTSEIYWRHRDFCHRGRITDPMEAAFSIKETVTGCIHAWASEFKHIILTLSGGLDSSIVLGCLASAASRPHIICCNYYTPEEISDERHFAREAAAAAGVELIELPEEPEQVDFSIIDKFPIQPEPRPWRQGIGYGKSQYDLYRKTNADAFFSGEGGDMVFYQGAEKGIEDFVWHNGLSPEILKYAMLHARLKRLSLWSVLSSALRARISPKQWNFMSWAQSTLSTGPATTPNNILELIEDRTKHWSEALNGMSYGKANQIISLMLSNYMTRPHGYGPPLPVVQPLYSQPIVELVMSLPVYLFSWPGVDRGLARLAFEDIIPLSIKHRQSKGSPSIFYKKLSQRYIDYVEKSHLGYNLDDIISHVFAESNLNRPDEVKERLKNNDGRLFDIIPVFYWKKKLYNYF